MEHASIKQTILKQYRLQVVILLCVIGLGVMGDRLFGGGMGLVVFIEAWSSISHADAGFKRAKKTINPEEMRAWALDAADKKLSPQKAFASMPVALRKLYGEPPEVNVESKGVFLLWGGGFFSWSLRIGNTNDLMPFNSDNPDCPYNFEWKPGIYYTREADWKLR